MTRGREGFIMVEVMAAIIIIATGVLGVVACYRCGVGLMVRHNYKQEALTIAQETMVLLREKGSIGQVDVMQGRFHIRGGQQEGIYNRYNLLFVEVYLDQEATPLVNLVGYE
jgi:hypothetical protein